MYIKEIVLSNFRNYKYEKIILFNKKNIIYGKNAQGKTNIIESIYISAFGKTKRTTNIKDVIKYKEEEAHIKVYLYDNKEKEIDIHITKENKQIFLNKEKIKNIKYLIGIENIVIFTPEDLEIIKEGPSKRRKYINNIICQIDREYLLTIIEYNKILKQKNRELKQKNIDYDLIEIYNEKLLQKGKKIIEKREKYINEINKESNKIYNEITKGKEKIKIKYKPSVLIEEYSKKQKLIIKEEKEAKTTLIGIHLDDIEININEKNARKFASNGQQRSIIIAMKYAEAEIIKKLKNKQPIIILDDVLSELDEQRQDYILNKKDNCQTLITCTDKEKIKNKINEKAKYIFVKEGTIITK